MVSPPRSPRARRDGALRRLRRVRLVLTAGSLVLTGAFSEAAARSFSGHTRTRSPTGTRSTRRPRPKRPAAVRPPAHAPTSVAQATATTHTTTRATTTPAPAPAATTTAASPAPVVSGGS